MLFCSASVMSNSTELCASQFQPRASPPGIPRAFEKIVRMPGPTSNICQLANAPPPVPTMMVKSLPPSPPTPFDQYTKVLVAIFNKYNCFSSIELHKTGLGHRFTYEYNILKNKKRKNIQCDREMVTGHSPN